MFVTGSYDSCLVFKMIFLSLVSSTVVIAGTMVGDTVIGSL